MPDMQGHCPVELSRDICENFTILGDGLYSGLHTKESILMIKHTSPTRISTLVLKVNS